MLRAQFAATTANVLHKGGWSYGKGLTPNAVYCPYPKGQRSQTHIKVIKLLELPQPQQHKKNLWTVFKS